MLITYPHPDDGNDQGDRVKQNNAQESLVLHQSEQRMQALVESAMDAIIAIDDTFNVVLFNPAAAAMFGISSRDAIGSSIQRFIPSRFRDSHAHHVNDFGSGGQTTRRMGRLGQIIGLRANGEEFPAEASISSVEIQGKKLYTAIIRDVSEKVRFENALRQSEAENRALIRAIPDLIFTNHINGEYLSVHAPDPGQLFIPPEQFLHRTVAQIMPKSFADLMMKAFADAIDAGVVQEVKYSLISEGEERHFEIRVSAITHETLISIVRDISDLTQNQENGKRILNIMLDERTRELAENEARHLTLLNMLEIGIVQHAPNGEVVFANPAALRLLGTTESQILGKSCIVEMCDVIQENGATFSADIHPVAIAFATCQPVRDVIMGVYRPIAQDRVWLLVSAIPELDTNGAVKHLICTINDVTDRYVSRKNMLESKERLNKLVESALDAIILLDQSHHVVLYNLAAETLFGVPKDQAIGGSIDRFMPQRYREAHANHVHAFRETGVAARSMGNLTRVMGLRANGEEFAAEATISQFIIDGGKQYAIIMRDVSERRRMEDALQTSLTEKTCLLNEVHHRVKNNLQVISSLLSLEARRHDYAGTKAVLNEMQARIRSMALLHESLYREGIFASVDLGAYLNQVVVQAFRAQLKRDGTIRLQLNLASVQVSMDQAMPCGLLVNELISNCIKHAFPEGRSGELSVSLQPVALSNQWHLQVSDNGVGLPDDFETRKENSLGLQLVTDLSTQLGGKLEIERGETQGTRFCVNFSVESLKSPAVNVS